MADKPPKKAGSQGSFYTPADPKYSIVDSALDSIRFTLERSLTRCEKGHLAAKSSFLDSEGKSMEWHDFGKLEGPGWAANAVGGAHEIHRMGKFLNKPDWVRDSLSILDHVLEHGFIDEDSGFIKGYRKIAGGEFCLNYKGNSDWFCPGSMAKIGYQLLMFAEDLKDDPRAERMKRIATRCADWIHRHVKSTSGGWIPRRCGPDGKAYPLTPEGKEDPLSESSADPLFILQLSTALTERKMAEYSEWIREKTEVFIERGGVFGSINHDTYDEHENVSYSVAFRTLLPVSQLLGDKEIREFAYETCLKGLDQFKMREDRNGVATRGLLFMEKSWDTAYLWENAEAALAYFEAALDTADEQPTGCSQHERDGLVILRAAAKHHHGPHGFLTEGVDWNNHVGEKHHFDGAKFGDIKYTEPFLNNQHIVEPTLVYLERLARVHHDETSAEWMDCEDNVLLRLP